MTAEIDLGELEKFLSCMRDNLILFIAKKGVELRSNASGRTPTSDDDTDVDDKESIAREIDSAKSKLKEIEIKLQRISDGEYDGRCEECNEAIPIARLKAVPTAIYCVSCQRSKEEE